MHESAGGLGVLLVSPCHWGRVRGLSFCHSDTALSFVAVEGAESSNDSDFGREFRRPNLLSEQGQLQRWVRLLRGLSEALFSVSEDGVSTTSPDSHCRGCPA